MHGPLVRAGQVNECPVGCKVNTFFTATTTALTETIEDEGSSGKYSTFHMPDSDFFFQAGVSHGEKLKIEAAQYGVLPLPFVFGGGISRSPSRRVSGATAAAQQCSSGLMCREPFLSTLLGSSTCCSHIHTYVCRIRTAVTILVD